MLTGMHRSTLTPNTSDTETETLYWAVASHRQPHSQTLESKTNIIRMLWNKLRPIKSRVNETELSANVIQRQWKANLGK